MLNSSATQGRPDDCLGRFRECDDKRLNEVRKFGDGDLQSARNHAMAVLPLDADDSHDISDDFNFRNAVAENLWLGRRINWFVHSLFSFLFLLLQAGSPALALEHSPRPTDAGADRYSMVMS